MQSALVAVIVVLARHLRLIGWTMVMGIGGVLAVTLVTGPYYVAESSFRPQGRNEDVDPLASVATRFGFGIGIFREPLEFYARLLRSRSILEATVTSTYSTGEQEKGRADLVRIFGVDGDTRQEKLSAATKKLEDLITINVALDAGIITVQVRADRPELATEINRRLLQLLDEFNIERRKSQTKAEREFVEARLADAERELRAAEAAMAAFLERNRSYTTSPQLTFEASRLQRQVEIQQQVYVTLAEALERARIEEVRNTPVITVIDPPEGSARERHDAVRNAVIILGLAAMAAGTIILALEYIAYLRMEVPEQYKLLKEYLDRIRRPFGARRGRS